MAKVQIDLGYEQYRVRGVLYTGICVVESVLASSLITRHAQVTGNTIDAIPVEETQVTTTENPTIVSSETLVDKDDTEDEDSEKEEEKELQDSDDDSGDDDPDDEDSDEKVETPAPTTPPVTDPPKEEGTRRARRKNRPKE